MSVFLVTWNLNKEGVAYNTARTRFLKQLAAFDYKQDPGLETVAWVSTNLNVFELDVYLRQALDTNDRLFVSKLNRGEYQGWLLPVMWDWIRERL